MSNPDVIMICVAVAIVGILIGAVLGTVHERIWNPRECQCCYCRAKRGRK